MPITGKLTVTELQARHDAGGADAIVPYAPALIVFPGQDGTTSVSWIHNTDVLEVKPDTPSEYVEANSKPHVVPGDTVVIPLFVRDGNAAVVGRDNNCDVVLESPRVSKKHATIVRSNRQFVILDIGSANGTKVDGLWLKGNTTYNLQPGRSIEFADVGTVFLDLAGLLDICRED